MLKKTQQNPQRKTIRISIKRYYNKRIFIDSNRDASDTINDALNDTLNDALNDTINDRLNDSVMTTYTIISSHPRNPNVMFFYERLVCPEKKVVVSTRYSQTYKRKECHCQSQRKPRHRSSTAGERQVYCYSSVCRVGCCKRNCANRG